MMTVDILCLSIVYTGYIDITASSFPPNFKLISSFCARNVIHHRSYVSFGGDLSTYSITIRAM